MNGKILKAGLIGGLVGGIAMAMWEMTIAAAQGHSFYAPLHAIGHTVFRSIPLMGGFSITAVLGGAMVHMVVSMMLGIALAIMIQLTGGLSRATMIVMGSLFALAVGVVNEFVIWKAIDPMVTSMLTPWVFLSGHVVFGAVTVAVAGWIGGWGKTRSYLQELLHTKA